MARSLEIEGTPFLCTSMFQCSFVYPYPSVAEVAEGSSDYDPRKTRTKTQTTPDSVFTRERRNSGHGLSLGCFWGRGRRGGSQCFAVPCYSLPYEQVRISGFCSVFLALAVFSTQFSEGTKTQRMLRNQRKTKKPSLTSKEKP